MSSSMQQRRENILAQAYQHGRVEVSRLSAELKVSEATVRRDLHILADEGRLQLTHGGASVVAQSDFSFLSKSVRNVDAKKTLGELACTLIQDGDQIFLDSGTTSFETASYLRSKKGLTVIVNSIRTAQELTAPGVQVLLLGGQYRPDRMDAVGPMAEASLEQLRGYRAFFGTDGLAMDFGPTSSDVESAAVISQAVDNARETVLLADSSKFGSPALYRIVKWNQVSTVVTERRPDEAWMEFLEHKEIKVVYPQRSSNETTDEALSSGQAPPQEL
jgi:DeoR family transcriptional regulator of aga operon